MDESRLRPVRSGTLGAADTRHLFAAAARLARRLPPQPLDDRIMTDSRALAGAMARTLAAWPVHAPDPVAFRHVSVADMRAVIALARRADPGHPSIDRVASAFDDPSVDPRHRATASSNRRASQPDKTNPLDD